MAQTIKLKRSATSGAVPTTSALELGEMAINTHDGKAYIKKDDGTESVIEIGKTYSAGTGISLSGNEFSLTDTNAKLNLTGGTLTGGLTISVPDTGSAPAMSATLNIRGYEGRGAGIKIRDNQNSASNSSSREWFIGSGYAQSGFNIGYSATGSQSSYTAQNKLSIDTSGNVTAAGTITATGYNDANWNTAYGWGNHASAGYYAASNPNGYTNDQTAAEILTAIKTVDGSGSGLDADTVDGVQLSQIIYGSNSTGTQQATFTDWNSINKSGFYSDDDALNKWSTANWSSVVHHRLYSSNNNFATQLGFDTYNNNLYTRTNSSGTWTSWDKIWHAGVDGSGSGLDADTLDGYQSSYFATQGNLGAYLQKAGGTMTGNIAINKTSPEITLHDTNSSTGSFPKINFTTTNNQGVSLYHNEFDNELPAGGYGLVLDAASNNTQYPTAGTLSLVVKGEIFAGSTTLSGTNKVWHEGTLTTTNKSNYDTAYGWGNHASAGYLTSYTDTNTTYSAGTGVTLTGTTFSLTDTNAKLNLSGGTLTGNLAIDKNTPRIDFRADSSGTNVGGRIELNENGNLWVNAAGGKDLWLNWDAPHSPASKADLRVGDGNGGSEIFSVSGSNRTVTINSNTAWHAGNDGSGSGLDADTLDGYQSSYFATQGNLGAYLRSNADDTMSEKLTFSQAGPSTYMQNPGGVTFSSVTSGDGTIVLRNLSEGIRFEDENNWDYNKWAGIKYDSSATTMYVGGPASSVFTSNSNPPSIDVNFVGLNSSGLKKDGNVVWHAGNDGSGSGLDADLLDGQHGSYYYSAGNPPPLTADPTLTLTGDVTGSATFTNLGNATLTAVVNNDSHYHSQVYIPDTRGAQRAPSYYPDKYVSFDFQQNTDTLAGGDQWNVLQTVAPWASYNNSHRQQQLAWTGTGGLKFRYSTSDSAWAGWQTLWTSGNDGSGSGLDADTLDGYQSGYFATQGNLGNYYLASNPNGYTNDQTAAEILTAIKTVDGSGSGLDADTLDGVNGASYLRSDADDTLTGNLQINSHVINMDLNNINDNAIDQREVRSSTWPYHFVTHSVGNDNSSGFWVGSNGYPDMRLRKDTSTVRALISSWETSYVSNGFNINGNTAWHAGNDGSGSGLDADTLDGYQSSYFATQGNLGAYLQKSGGTATGTLTVRDVKFSAGYHLQRSDHHSGHLEGSYNNVGGNSTNTNPIYTIGSSYNPASTTLGNMYGVGFSKNTASFMTGALDAGNNSGWGLYVAADGDARVFLNGSHGIISSTGQHYANSSLVWNAGNDGAGSGLDADLLDGQQGSYYYSAANLPPKIKAGGTGPSTENLNSIANSVSTGQLEYRGFNSSSSNSPPVSDNANGVITVGQHSGNYNAQLAFSSNGNMYWRDNPGSSFGSWRTVWDSGNDGSGSGLDADTLDGYQSSYFATQGNLGAYLQKAGGTMTGKLGLGVAANTTNFLRIARQTGHPNIKSSDPYLLMDSNGSQVGLNWYSSDNVSLAGGGGSVHVGGTSPSERLQVNGNLRVDGSLKINSTTVIDSNRQIIANKSSATTSDAAATIISKGTVDTTTGYQPQNWHITFQDGGGTVRGKITSSHYATQYSTSSDYRLKEDIQPIANATERLLAIKAVNFKWINGQQRSDGFIAHELQEHLPEAVTGEKDATTEVTETIVADDGTETEVTTTVPEMQGIDQSKLVPLLVKTIQELEARISALENA